MKNHSKITKNMFFLKICVFLRKKSARQGCTTQITELEMHQNPHFQQIPLKINKKQKINPPSTITIPESDICFSIPDEVGFEMEGLLVNHFSGMNLNA